jgi:UDP-glucose 4-epimerase
VKVHVLVIGGAGYIGSHVVLRLLDAGHHVTVYDNLRHGLHANLHDGATFIHGDILDQISLRAALIESGTPVDAVVHLAAAKAAGESMILPELYAQNNIAGTVSILNSMTAVGVSKIVFSSSAAVYGEPEYVPIDENHPTKPINFYGFTKLEIEQLLGWYDQLRNTRFASLRYFNAAGYDPEGRVHGLEQQPANLLPLIMETAIGMRPELEIYGNDYDTPDGTCVRDYIHVTDLADAHARALDWICANDTSLIVNLGSERGVSVQEMVDTARGVTGCSITSRVVERRPGDPATLIASSELARSTLGWKTSHSAAETLLKTTWDAYQRSVGD